MSKANLNHTLYLCLVMLVTCFLPCSGLAQDASNRRGFQPGNSFAIGDFETINTTNGNLMLKFPLAGLPAGRNGLSAGINLYYNSKLMDSELNYFPKENEECEMVGTEPAILVCPYYQKLVLRDSEQGGWQFGTGYRLKLIDRHSEFNNVPQEQGWNAYSYALNNPMKYLDPNGMRWAQRQLSNGGIEFMWFEGDDAYNAAIDSSSETYQGWTAVSFDETKPLTIATRSRTESCLISMCYFVELAQLDPNGEVDTGQVSFTSADILVDLGTRKLFGKSWLEGKRSFETTIAGLIDGLPSLPMSGGSFPQTPGTPDNMGNSRFGKEVMKWGTGDEAARSRMGTLTREELQRAGVTKEIAAQWRDFYREVARVTPANTSAAGRADLMQRAVELLTQ